MDDLTRALTMIFVAGAIGAVALSWRSMAAAEAGEGEYYALLLTSMLGMVILVAASNFVVLFLGFELLSIPLYVLCATEMRARALAGVRPEVPDHRVGRVGDAAVRAVAASTARRARPTTRASPPRRPTSPTTRCS